MFKRIMVPIDLKHVDKLDKSLDVVEKLASAYGSTVIFVGVTASVPSEIARNETEFADKLAGFAKQQSQQHSMTVESHTIVSSDPAAELDTNLLDAIDNLNSDLVVMATHVPGVRDYFFGNHGNYLSDHANVSVFLVRNDQG